MSAFRLTLVRHGCATGSHDHVFGSTNAPLSADGRAQLRSRWQQLTAQPVDAIASSTLARCADFALDAAASLGLQLHLAHGFAEQHLGDLDGKSKANWSAQELQAWDDWQRNPQASPLPNGESWDDFSARTLAAFHEWLARTPDAEHRLLFAHQGTIKALLLHAFGLPASRHSQFWVAPAGVVSLWWDNEANGWPPMLLALDNTLPD
ncbi:histidine phosphatase family protein [Chitinilyticum piscinae]|uniref:Histidine phosphatase family protein n=1 Tax=Chitinilyticum piscinae TaxID=2866724 RepID=A0A8J7KE85_9NEIS|nr:histidine phosphatase family protein [Chitinilyticum piscinae]MBE9609204.1 histidine phosphatase family protein [Chitinilyticum piscinae]